MMFSNFAFVWPQVFPIAIFVIIVLAIIFYFYNLRINKLYKNSLINSNYYLSLDLLNNKNQDSLQKYNDLSVKYKTGVRFASISIILILIFSIFLLARPAQIIKSSKGLQSRDIILCADVSGSVLQYDKELFQSYKNAINTFTTERIGLVIFDSTSRVVFPLTDDKKLINQKLSEAIDVLEPIHNETKQNSLSSTQTQKINNFLAGTRQKDDKASLVGEGIASCLMQFDNNDDRNRSLILTTDNESSGKSIFTLNDSLQYASDMATTVYAIYAANSALVVPKSSQSLQKNVEQNKGYFYSSIKDESIKDVINSILASQKSQYQDSSETIISEHSEYALFLLIPLFIIYLIIMSRLKQ